MSTTRYPPSARAHVPEALSALGIGVIPAGTGAWRLAGIGGGGRRCHEARRRSRGDGRTGTPPIGGWPVPAPGCHGRTVAWTVGDVTGRARVRQPRHTAHARQLRLGGRGLPRRVARAPLPRPEDRGRPPLRIPDPL